LVDQQPQSFSNRRMIVDQYDSQRGVHYRHSIPSVVGLAKKINYGFSNG
jgi:hypothetical protein